jgi:hypothetical protein
MRSDSPASRIPLGAGFPISQKITPHLVEDGVVAVRWRALESSRREQHNGMLCVDTRDVLSRV